MGKIVVTEFISLDGIVEDPGRDESYRHAGWTFPFDSGVEGNQLKLAELNAADALLLGRVTYDGFAAAWPTVQDGAGFAEKMNGMPKYVVSKTLQDPTWDNTTVLSGDPVAEITALRDKVARDILVHGSSQLVHLLASNDLVDRYNLMVFPVLLGSGRKLFPDAGLEVPTRFRAPAVKQVGDVQWVVLERDRSNSQARPRHRDTVGCVKTLLPAYRVTDLAASLEFYTALGYGEVGRVEISPGARWADMTIGDGASLAVLKFPGEKVATLELVHRPADEPVEIGTGFSHLVVQVDDLAATVEALSQSGLRPGTAERPAGPDGPQTAWITDPDGYRIELVQWPPGHPDGVTAADFG